MQARVISLVGFVLINASFLACKGTDSRSETKDVNSPVSISSQRGIAREIVIFYANETPDSDLVKGYYDKIDATLAKLDSDEPSPLYAKIRNGYKQDIQRFPAQVRKDVEGLKKQLCTERKNKRLGLVVFTNELARQGKFEYCLPDPYDGTIQFGELKLEIPADVVDDFRYSQSPLALPSGIAAARTAVLQMLNTRDMPLTDYTYVWISKSHGGNDMMVVPKLLHKMDTLSDSELETHFKKIAASTSYSEMKLAELKVGDLKIGDLLVGDVKFRDLKVGDLKYGDLKVGDLKVGDLKVGDLKMGDLKFGDLKVGDLKVGDLKIGDLKFGDLKYGDLKVGDLKVGDLKVGDLKIGDLKYGDLKVGDLKVGDLKYGDLKYGDLKVGDLAAVDPTAELHSLGVTKERFLGELKAFNLHFDTLFFESCNSELPESLVLDLKREANSGEYSATLGDIYTSDKLGLKFETVNYGSLSLSSETTFSDALKAALDKAARK